MEQLQKQYQELTFTDDFMFGKVLVNNPEICRRLLEVLLEIRIKKISFPERQKTIEILSDGKGIRLDMVCRYTGLKIFVRRIEIFC